MSRLVVRPTRLREARRYIGQNHSHNEPPQGWLFGCSVWDGDQLAGVGVAGRPVGQGLDDGSTMEVTRVCTLGIRNACSLLYGRLCRAAAALGYTTAFTYTLESECAACVRAAGFTRDGEVKTRGWNRPTRTQYDTNLFGERRAQEDKVRWKRSL